MLDFLGIRLLIGLRLKLDSDETVRSASARLNWSGFLTTGCGSTLRLSGTISRADDWKWESSLNTWIDCDRFWWCLELSWDCSFVESYVIATSAEGLSSIFSMGWMPEKQIMSWDSSVYSKIVSFCVPLKPLPNEWSWIRISFTSIDVKVPFYGYYCEHPSEASYY